MRSDDGRGRAEPPAAAAQRVPAAEGGVDQIDELGIVQDLVDRAELGTPQLVAVGQQHFEDAALRIRATDHGASMETAWPRCFWGEVATDDICCHHGAPPLDPSRKIERSDTDSIPRPARAAGRGHPFCTVK